MRTAWDMFSDDPEFDAERYFAEPEYEDWEERLDRLKAERDADPDYYEYREY